MKKTSLGCVAAIAAIAAFNACAQNPAELARTKRCTTCHSMDKQKTGPAFKQIAAKYKGKPDAASMLVAEIKAGTKHPQVKATDAELKTLVDYVLSSGK